jgi:hypothetical protein
MARFGFKSSGNLDNTTKFLKDVGSEDIAVTLHKYGNDGVLALAENTPVDTGKTAGSWSYGVTKTKDGISLHWDNSNIQNGIQIVTLIENGHAARDGSWIPAQPFVKETIDVIEKKILDDTWKGG